MYTKDFGARDGVNLGTAVRVAHERLSSDGVEPGHTPRPRDRPKVRMLLSFQRPSHRFWKGGSFPRGVLPGTGTGFRLPRRTGEYSAENRCRERPPGGI